MKITVITGPNGELVGTAHGHAEEHRRMQAGPLAGPGQTLHELTVPDELAQLRDAAELHAQIARHLPKR